MCSSAFNGPLVRLKCIGNIMAKIENGDKAAPEQPLIDLDMYNNKYTITTLKVIFCMCFGE